MGKEKKMKKPRKYYIGLWFLAGVYVLMAPFIFSDSVVGGVLWVAVIVILILVGKENKKTYIVKAAEFEKLTASKNGTGNANKVPDGEMNYNILDDIWFTDVLRYQYENDLCLSENAMDLIKGNGGRSIDFVQEPENEHDNKAVAVYFKKQKIGYVYRGRTQDMINDWMSRNWHIDGHINKYSVEENKATYKIGFYEPLSNFKSKSCTLTKTNKRIDEDSTRRDNLETCSEDERLIVDESDGSYVVRDASYSEVGELPESAASFIEDNEHESVLCILDKLTETDSGRLKAVATIYLLPFDLD